MSTPLPPLRANWNKRSICIIIAVILIMCLIIFSGFIFGPYYYQYRDIGSDTVNGYMPMYAEIAHKIQSGDMGYYSFHYNAGRSIASNQPISCDIFALPFYIAFLLFGIEGMLASFIYIGILKIILAAVFCYWLLALRPFQEKTKILVSILYAFNGFMTLWGQHYFFSTAVVLFPLLLIAIDYAFSGRRTALLYLSLITCLIMLVNAYTAYMMLLAGVLYLIYLIVRSSRRSFISCNIKCALRMALFVIIGIMMSAVIFFPFAAGLLGGTRLGVGGSMFTTLYHNLFAIFPGENLISTLLRYFSNNLQGLGGTYNGIANYYEAPQLFFSVLFLPFALQYILYTINDSTSRKQKAANIVVVLLTFVSLLWPAVCVTFNMFQAVSYRFTFLLMPVFALITAHALNHIFKKGMVYRKTFCISVALTIILLAYIMLSGSPAGRRLPFISIVCAILASLLVYWYANRSQGYGATAKRILIFGFMALMLVNIGTDAYYTANIKRVRSEKTDIDISGNHKGDVLAAVDYIKAIDPIEAYRVEQRLPSYSVQDSAVFGYNGISGYDSLQTKYVMDFYRMMGIQTMGAYFLPGYAGQEYHENPLPLDLMGIKYIISPIPQMLTDLELIKDFNGIKVYRNNMAKSLGYMYYSYMDERDIISGEGIVSGSLWPLLKAVAVDKKMLAYAGAMDAYQFDSEKVEKYISIPFTDLFDGDISAMACVIAKSEIASNRSLTLKADGIDPQCIFTAHQQKPDSTRDYNNILLSLNVESADTNTLQVYYRAAGEAFSEINSKTVAIDHQGKTALIVALPHDVEAIRLDISNGESIISDIQLLDRASFVRKEKPNAAEAMRFSKFSSSLIEGEVNAEKDGFLFFSIPFESGWEVYVDGNKADVIRANIAFMGVEVKEGAHSITLRYHTAGVREGIFASVAGIVLLLISSYIFMYRSGKRSAAPRSVV